jgi:uncharacterized membrane protein YciS (DUF1049 family)
MMDWLQQNIFQVIGLVCSTFTFVWIISKHYFQLENRINNVEAEIKRLNAQLDKDLIDLKGVVEQLREDLKELTKVILQK